MVFGKTLGLQCDKYGVNALKWFQKMAEELWNNQSKPVY